MKKKILYGNEAKEKLLSGANQLASAVSVTLGPKGRNAVYLDARGNPVITKDGIAVASQVINLPDRYEQLGADIIRQAASRTCDNAGDGTTTSTILAADMFDKALYELNSTNKNPIDIQREMEDTRDKVLKVLEGISISCDSIDKIKNVATISANNDPQIGDIIAEGISAVGNDGVLTIEDSPDSTTYLELTEGMGLKRGYMSPYLITDEKKSTCELDNCLILVTDQKIETVVILMEILTKVAETGRPLLIIAPELSEEALKGLVVNHVKGIIKCCAIKSPNFGKRRTDIIKDICALTGATLLTEETGNSFKDADISHLGRAKKVIVDRSSTKIIEGEGDQDAIDNRISDAKICIEQASCEADKQEAQERLSKLNGAVGIIRVGGSTEVEQIERKARVEDALYATRSAIEEGIVYGSGLALHICSNRILEGSKIVLGACKAPMMQVYDNAGCLDLYEEIIDKNEGIGYNLNTKEKGNLIEMGIIDPVKVTKNAVINAVSAASMLITTEVALMDVDPEDLEDE